ncbi:MAG TPA: ROK family protein [Spirochaetota bacterium]|jgi:glucokinase|nr:MAG: Glucokinase [Spirochaetes bacterium ADurb.Bin133]HNZ26491.1 ROK family protein [Spirochaetota bacterium]HPY87270.1 ROK family protein [Spirochaetota bacterium]HQB60549.1 ROK family protein [Spirochaetota bacterium]
MKYYSGIDLGGTKIYAIVIDETGKVLGRYKIKTEGENDADKLAVKIADCYLESLKLSGIAEKDITALGLAVPSSVNVDLGILKYAPNLGMKNVEFLKILKRKINKPMFMDNDVNMGIFGEYSLGSARKYKHVYGLFVGTGIGGGYILDGKVIRGVSYTAGEIGHMIVKIGGPMCNCGKSGCLEAIAGKVGIINYIKKQVEKKGKKTALSDISPDWRKTVGSSALRKCYEMEDEVVVKAINKAAKTIGIACANLVDVVGVEAIVLGGGLIEEMGEVFTPMVEENMKSYSIADGANGVALIKAELGDDAVALGAAWFTSLEENKNYLK